MILLFVYSAVTAAGVRGDGQSRVASLTHTVTQMGKSGAGQMEHMERKVSGSGLKMAKRARNGRIKPPGSAGGQEAVG
ncbi:MAG TPA: hypothetical protein DCR38_03380, partial [Butyricimonas virosa]|nr:hypothetical protein [Butyricimonas virosa]